MVSLVKKMNEFLFIEYLKKKIPGSGRLSVGIGDDAAVLKKTGPGHLVVSTDMLVEDVDFVLDELSPEMIGRKTLAVSLSDLAAMGAEPLAFVLSIGKPAYVSTKWLGRFYNGLLKLARQYKIDCVGGDFSRAKEFSVSVTILGTATKPVLRSGARAGDWVGVTGRLGGSILRHHFEFTPRVKEGLWLMRSGLVHAMIDISDGLYQDLHHVLRASRVGAAIDLAGIPVSADAIRLSRGNKSAALKRALTDGEDFELLFTAAPRQKMMLEKIWKKKFQKVPLTWIGKIERKTPRIAWRREGKKVSPPKLLRKGFSHF